MHRTTDGAVRALRTIFATLLATACLTGAHAADGGDEGDEALAPIPYLPDALGPYHWPITTSSPRAQQYFDQGMQLRYGYGMNDAARSMAMARRLDPDCAICFWGEAFALGSFLNAGMSAENAPLAHTAIQRAYERIDNASPVEADLIRAALVRYPADYDPDNRRPVDEAFAEAMAEVYEKHPDHSEVAIVYTISLFLLEERRGYRDLEDPDGTLVDRLKRLSDNGFPNYFGEQRFGRGGRNLERAEALFSGHRLAREPRSMAISAARSLLFNAVLSRRVADGTWSRLIEGELANLDGTGSVFAIAEPDAELRKRAAELDIHPTGPLWGRTGTKATLRVRELELAVAATYPDAASGLEGCAAPARRALRERARCLDWEQTSATLSLEFELGRGSFATALLRELVTLR